MGTVHEAPSTHIQSEVLAHKPGYKVVRVHVPAGEMLPAHVATMDVAVVVAAGEGRMQLGEQEYALEPGAILEVPPGVNHGIYADEDLDIVLVQGVDMEDVPVDDLVS